MVQISRKRKRWTHSANTKPQCDDKDQKTPNLALHEFGEEVTYGSVGTSQWLTPEEMALFPLTSLYFQEGRPHDPFTVPVGTSVGLTLRGSHAGNQLLSSQEGNGVPYPEDSSLWHRHLMKTAFLVCTELYRINHSPCTMFSLSLVWTDSG